MGVLLMLLALVSPAFAVADRAWSPTETGRDAVGESPNSTPILSVMPDGAMLVTEDITAVFTGEYHWISRSIPIEYPGPRGTNYTLFLKIGGVTDENQQPLKYETSIRGAYRYLKIYLDNAFNTDKTIRITYTVQNGVRFFDDHDELYWNVTGNDWPVPIDNASALVVFPDSASGSLRAQAFTGAYGSAERDAQSRSRRQPGHDRNQPSASHARRVDVGRLSAEGHSARARSHHPRALVRAQQRHRSAARVRLHRHVHHVVVQGTRPEGRSLRGPHVRTAERHVAGRDGIAGG